SRGSPGAESRHTTLRASVDWSHSMLGAAERTLFRRLGVFSGGCYLVAIEAICVIDDAVDPFDLVSGLVDKSMLQVEDLSLPRYRLLESLPGSARHDRRGRVVQ